jgi:dimethylglycine catabolism A
MKLFEKINVGGLELKNRIMFPPMVTRRGDFENFVTEDCKKFYVNLAKGGVGSLVIEMTSVSKTLPLLLGLYTDEHTAGFKEMTDEIHSSSDAKIFIQLGDSLPPLLNVEEIPLEMIDYFCHNLTAASVRAKDAGFDGIELHGAHGYILSSFLSLRNKRKDEYGKNSEGRIKLTKKVLKGVKDACGKEFPVGIRINGDDFIVGGNTLKQTKIIAKELVKEGIAYLSISAGAKMQDAWHPEENQSLYPYPKPGPWTGSAGYSGHRCVPPHYMPDGVNVYLAEEIRKEIAGYNVPVITAGKIPDPEFAESVLTERRADIVGICRPILCDFNWPVKAETGRADKIVKCVYCNKCMEAPRLMRPTACIQGKNKKEKE